MCDLYYHHHIWEFLDMVALQMNPTEVCSQIGLCQFNVPGQREAGIASVLDKEEYISSGVEGNDPRCGVCEMAVVWVQNQLTENIPIDEIDTYLNQVYP
jgi:phytepsin